MAECAVVIDVREQWEWDKGYISCATRLQVQKDPDNWEEDLLELAGGDKDTPIVFYCAAGVRADRAVGIIQAEGYTDVTNGGGYTPQNDLLEAVCDACRTGSEAASQDLQVILEEFPEYDDPWYLRWYVWVAVVLGVLVLVGVGVGVWWYRRKGLKAAVPVSPQNPA
uniref:Rhodanese domain-containing protein n=1 Tax=Hemiselmis andersenii TaxID=464988 RepID=A0A6U4M456_HEMAN|mmetsp:Transcript_18846/g.43517  ORF Transcript_18846/g.43517 Transcript_18846/m.43517 type:complete len:167 (+) Transcript_18846:218-718(+)